MLPGGLNQFSDEQLLQFINQNPDLKRQFDLYAQSSAKPQQPKTKPLTDSEYLKLKEIKDYLDSEGGMLIEPTPHFVLKSFDENGEKIFFNVTAHSVVDKPEEKQLVDYNNEAGIRVPMSVGSIKEDHDVKGDICKVIDLVVNPEVAGNIQKDENLRVFFCSLIQSYILQKYNLKLQDKFISLKMKYKGKGVQFQRVKGKKPPKVEIIDEKPNDSSHLNQANDEDEEDETERSPVRKRAREQYEKEALTQPKEHDAREPEWDLIVGYSDGLEDVYDGDLNLALVEYYRFEIEMPLLVTGVAIKLRSTEEQFSLLAGRLYKLQLRFPSKIDLKSISANFVKKKRQLQLQAMIAHAGRDEVLVTRAKQADGEKKPLQIEQLGLSDKLKGFSNALLDDIV